MTASSASPAHTLTTQEVAVLTALVDGGSFTAAAERLGITQSAVSKTVQQIEAAFGVDLFTRGRSGARPCAALMRVLPQLRQIERAVEEVSLALRGSDAQLRGTVRVAGFRSAVSVLLPPAVAKFMSRHEEVAVSLMAVREQDGGVRQKLEAGAADFGVTTVKPAAHLRSTYLGSDRYALVRPKSTARRFVPERERLVLWKERCSDLVPQIMRAHNWSAAKQMEADTDTAVLGMIAHGGGFSIMPELALEPLPAMLEKVELPIEFRRGVWLCALPQTWESQIGRVVTRYVKLAARERLGSEKPTIRV